MQVSRIIIYFSIESVKHNMQVFVCPIIFFLYRVQLYGIMCQGGQSLWVTMKSTNL
nr:MAG TPA: hypothetical protein [Caudoviricetes sp.]